MDDLSRELFDKHDVEVEIIDSDVVTADDVSAELFGRSLNDREYAELVAAPNESKVTVFPDPDWTNRLVILTDNATYYAETQVRRVFKADGVLTVNNETIRIHDDAPVGVGTRIFARQVEMARRLGVRRFITSAAGSPNDPEYNGYYTLPRLGYNARITRNRAALEEAGFVGVQDTNQLMLAGGANWWLLNGYPMRAEFDLSPESSMNLVLLAYLQENGVVAHE